MDKWAKKTNMPTPRGCLSTSVVNGKIYAIAGGADEDTINSIDVYDPAKDTWVRKPIKTTDRGYFSTCVVNGRIYAIGGGTDWLTVLDNGTAEEYTPEGWPFAVSPQGKLPTNWGQMKQNK
jgi:hypothetical protein